MQRAQAVYSGLNEGYYDRLECVLAPAMCIRNGDGRNNAVLLDARFKEIERNEFRVPAVSVRRSGGPLGHRVGDRHARLCVSRGAGRRRRDRLLWG